MSEEDRQRIRAWVTANEEQVRRVFGPVVKELVRIVKALAPLVRRIMAAYRRVQWERAQQAARFIAHHPDIAALDRWLDGMYTDPALC